MNNTFQLITAVFFFLFLFLWLAFIGLLALPSFFLPKRNIDLSKEVVDDQPTVCWLFTQKGLMSERHYEFESRVVAPFYDQMTFMGYGLLLMPAMWALTNYNFIDRPMLYVVKRWIRIHRYMIQNEEWVTFWELPFTRFCTGAAARVGLTLSYIIRP